MLGAGYPKFKIEEIFVNCIHKSHIMKRETVIDTVKDFPKEFELEDLIEKLVVIEKVEQGLTQLKKGKTVSHSKVKEIAKKW